MKNGDILDSIYLDYVNIKVNEYKQNDILDEELIVSQFTDVVYSASELIDFIEKMIFGIAHLTSFLTSC